ncbi:amino acid permease [uncultured bacterium]|uniref:Amino acid permease n=1 Tax=Acetilactobacillus jinshanensis TaxID=1720083 RepID=A0A4P6ZK65_9LACO|nr:APC family permease [Acetilactobacillus jinshanensis]QBP17630.1 amino acid permease [Acetilactobacillus jinshanensis]URL61957.1 amino acid permease [uncultured bacterium]
MNINKEKLGFWSIVLLGINAIIGSGIFLLPNFGMKSFGPASILVLFVDAFLACTIGMCFAECSGLFSETGGAYIYARQAFGNFFGYEVGIAAWVIRIIAEATMYMAFATALGGFFPALNSPFAHDVIVTIMGVFLMAINIAGIRVSSVLNNVVTVGKLVPILLVIVVGLAFLHPANFHPFFITKLTTMHNFSNTAITLFYIFTGVEGLVVSAGEMNNVKKNLPRAILIVLGVVTLIYVLVMVACVGVMGTKLANTSVPLQSTMDTAIGHWGGAIIAIGSILSIGGIGVAATFITPRSMIALSDHGIMPKSFAKRNRWNAPYVSIIVCTVLTLLLAYSGTFTKLAQISAVSRFAQYIPTCIAVMVFRKTMPKAKRAFKLPLGYTIPIIALAVSAWLLVETNVEELLWGLGALVIAVPFYFITREYRHKI